MSNKNCTYTFLDGQGQQRNIMGLSSMKAFLVDGGLDLFYPGGRFPWLSTESAIGSVADYALNPALKIDTSGQSVDPRATLDETPTNGVELQAAEQEDGSPKLTQAEAAKLMEWQSLGQKDGIKTHILTFYESQADKDAKRGRMTMATVTSGDRNSDKWSIDGDDQSFTYLAAAKKRGMEVGMAKAVKDGFVDGDSSAGGAEVNSRDAFTLQRMNDATGQMEPVTFKRGETIKIAAGQRPYQTGVITGISQAERKFKVDGLDLAHDFGYAYKADFDESARPKGEVDAELDKLEKRLNDGIAIQADGFIRTAKDVIERNSLGDYAKGRIAQLEKKASEVSGNALEKMRAETMEREAKEAKERTDAQAKVSEPKPAIDMTMDEWKAISKDFKDVQHAYKLLKPGGRIVAIMGEGVFFGQDQKAQDFRAWLELVGGTSEKLPDGSFMDPSLPVNTAVNARMVVIDRPAAETPTFSRSSEAAGSSLQGDRQERENPGYPQPTYQTVQAARDAARAQGISNQVAVMDTGKGYILAPKSNGPDQQQRTADARSVEDLRYVGVGGKNLSAASGWSIPVWRGDDQVDAGGAGRGRPTGARDDGVDAGERNAGEVAKRVAEVAKQAFGVPIIPVTGLGAYGVSYKGNAFIDVNEVASGKRNGPTKIAIATIGHEAGHVMQKSASPDERAAYKSLRQVVLRYLHPGKLDERTKFEQDAAVAAGQDPARYGREYATDELVNDINGAMWLDPKFWERLHEVDGGSTFRRVLYRFMQAATRFIEVAKGSRFDPESFVSSVEAVREAAAQAWAVKARGVSAPAELRDSPSFSRAMPTPSPQTSAWEAPADTYFDRRVVYALQDKHIDTKRVQAAITKTAGEIEDELNAYQREELYHGRAAKRAQDFLTQELNPMVEQLAKDKIELADFEEYLHARHAPEANRVLAERNPNQDMIDAGLEAATLEIEQIELELAATTDPAEIKVLSRRMREAQADLSKWSSVQAYRGTEEDRLRLSGMSDDQARAIMDALTPEQRAKLDDAAAQFDAIVGQNRQLMVDYDLEDQDTIDGWGQLFQHYVPLMREDEGNGVQQGMGTGQGFSIKGREVKSRTGSTRKVVDIVANVAMQRERIITRGEKNRVSQALMGLAALNPNPDFWKLGAPDRKRQYDPATNTVKVVTDPQYKNRENVVVAKVRNSKGNVTEVALTFNERDERAVRMAAAIKNLEDGQLNWALSNAAKVTRYFASINTQYNPIFGIVNVIRDLQGAAVNLAGTPLKDSKTRVIRNAIVAIGSIYREARKERKGGENESDWGKLWQEFQEVGGMTGFRDQFRDSQERARAIERTMNPEKWMESAFGKIVTVGGALKKPMTWAQDGGGWVLNWLSDYNLAMENGVRLAAYKEGLDKGLTQEQAASLAKNLTVNFNRRGSHGMQIGAAYAFFNAAMQGTARMGQAFTTMEDGRLKTLRLSPLGKKVLTGGLMMGVAQAAILAAAGFGDDEPPEFVREKNMILPLGWTGVTSDKGYATIPMPLGLHVIPGIGRHMAEFAMSGGKDPAGRVISIFGMLMDAFNPIGNAGWSAQTFTPTIVDPVVAVFENKDFTGRNIALESRDKNVPGHKLAKDTASSLAKFLSEAINTATGGNDYVSGRLSMTPDQIDYLLGQLTGGVGREALKVEQTIRGAITGEDVPLYKIPLVGRFFGDSSGSAGQSNIFRANIDRLDRAEKEIDGLRKDGRIQESNDLRQRSDPYLLAQARTAESQVQRLRRMKRDMVDKGASRESVREVERKISEAMGRLNKAVESRAK